VFITGNTSFRKYRAAISITIPKMLFTVPIHAPDFGKETANVPTTKNGNPIPSAYTNNIELPKKSFCVVATYVSTAARIGPVQGAAITPATSPMPNAPQTLAPPTCDDHCDHLEGSAISNTPNIDNANTMNRAAIAVMTHGFPITRPKTVPVAAAAMPSAVYITAIPSTYDPESSAATIFRLACRAPKILTVIGMSGNTQGVNVLNNPPMNTAA